MKTNIHINIVYPLNRENDIKEFQFFTQLDQTDEEYDITICSAPKYSIDGDAVRNIKTSFVLNRVIEPVEFLGILGILKELEITVNDFNSTADELGKYYYDKIYRYFHIFGVK